MEANEINLIDKFIKEDNNTIDNFEVVMFLDKEIDCVLIKEEPHAVVNSMIENIGLNYVSVHRALKSDEILAQVYTEWYTPIPKYQGQKVGCMPFQYIPGWLFSINSNKVNPEVKPVLNAYKKDVYRVLYEHYFGKTKTVFNAIRRQHQIAVRLKEINKEIFYLMKEHRQLKSESNQLMLNNYRQLSLDFTFDDTSTEHLKPFHQKALSE